MDEVEKIADSVAIIDHWTIQAIWTINKLKKQTWKDNMDDIFLKLTWKDIRDETISNTDWMKMRLQSRRK